MRKALLSIATFNFLWLVGCSGVMGLVSTPTPTATSTPTASPTATATITPSATATLTPTATPTEIVFTIIKYLSPIKAGHRTQLTIQVKPGDECFLAYTTAAGTKSTARGLGPRIATVDGICGWTWVIRRNSRPGEGFVEVTVNGVTVTMPFIIEPPDL